MILGFHWGIAGEGIEALREGDYWYERRALGTESDQAKPDYINRAIAAYQIALRDSQVEEIAAEQLLRAYYFQGCHASPSKEERMKSHTEAKQLGEQMHARYPKNKTIASLYALNLSLWGKEYGPFQAVKEGVGGKVYNLCHLAEDYQIIGRSHQLLPYIPIILNWPDKKLVLPNLLKAHEQNPGDLNTYLFIAEYYLEQKQYDEALRWIQTAEDRGVRPNFVLEDRRTRWKLRELKAEVERKKGKS
ncbi:MAG: hypothetical protein LBR60_08670 [Fibrobacter sp.]|nr:hypothetical protein [Fibrobacter sp.]